MTETQQNVDQTEIDKFSEIAAHWWDPQGQFKPLHAINPLRLSFIEEKCAGVFGKPKWQHFQSSHVLVRNSFGAENSRPHLTAAPECVAGKPQW